MPMRAQSARIGRYFRFCWPANHILPGGLTDPILPGPIHFVCWPRFQKPAPLWVTRVTGFLWDRGRDRLWRQGIDLIGDDRGGQVGKGIEDGAMFGQSEGGEFLDMTDDGFDDVAPVEQRLVEERHR